MTSHELGLLWDRLVDEADAPDPEYVVVAFARRVEALALERAAQACEREAAQERAMHDLYIDNVGARLTYLHSEKRLREVAVAVRALSKREQG